MNEAYLLVFMSISIVFGYFVGKSANEELKELNSPLKYAYIISAAAALGVAAYINIFISLAVFLLSVIILYFYNNKTSQAAVLFISGVLIFLVDEIFVFSAILFINMMILTGINYDKRFLKNLFMYIYFFVPAFIVFLVRYLLRV